MLGQEIKLHDTENIENAFVDKLPPILRFGRKRKICGQMKVSYSQPVANIEKHCSQMKGSHSQPVANSEKETDWFKECKHQKALVIKLTKTIDRQVKKIRGQNKKLEELAKQSRMLMRIVNRKF